MFIEKKDNLNFYDEKLIVIDEETHKYYYDGELINLPSATELIKLIDKYNFDYSKIDPEVLRISIEKGVCVHKRISDLIKYNKQTKCPHDVKSHNFEFGKLRKIIADLKSKNPGSSLISELSLIGFDYVGTIDLLLIHNDNSATIIDFKTTSSEHREKEALQLYLYEQLLRQSYKYHNLKIRGYGIINTRTDTRYLFNPKQMRQAKYEYDLIMSTLNEQLDFKV